MGLGSKLCVSKFTLASSLQLTISLPNAQLWVTVKCAWLELIRRLLEKESLLACLPTSSHARCYHAVGFVEETLASVPFHQFGSSARCVPLRLIRVEFRTGWAVVARPSLTSQTSLVDGKLALVADQRGMITVSVVSVAEA